MKTAETVKTYRCNLCECGQQKYWRSKRCWNCHFVGVEMEQETAIEAKTPLEHMNAIIAKCRGTIS